MVSADPSGPSGLCNGRLSTHARDGAKIAAAHARARRAAEDTRYRNDRPSGVRPVLSLCHTPDLRCTLRLFGRSRKSKGCFLFRVSGSGFAASPPRICFRRWPQGERDACTGSGCGWAVGGHAAAPHAGAGFFGCSGLDSVTAERAELRRMDSSTCARLGGALFYGRRLITRRWLRLVSPGMPGSRLEILLVSPGVCVRSCGGREATAFGASSHARD